MAKAPEGWVDLPPKCSIGFNYTIGHNDRLNYEFTSEYATIDFFVMTETQWNNWDAGSGSYTEQLYDNVDGGSGYWRPPYTKTKWYFVFFNDDNLSSTYLTFNTYYTPDVYHDLETPSMIPVILGVVFGILGGVTIAGIGFYYNMKKKSKRELIEDNVV